jgi:hypothetical protein
MKTISESLWLKPFIVLLISSQLSGCYHMKRVTKPPEEIMAEKPKRVVVEKSDSTKIELYNAFLENDTLKGYLFSGSGPTPESIKYYNKIAINEIQNIYIRALNPFTTILLISGVVMIMMTIYVSFAVGGFISTFSYW